MYGHLEEFDFSVVEECDQSKLNEREMYWIDYYKSTDPIYGYNILIGGDIREHNRILNQNQLNEIANLLATTDLTQTEIANKFGVGQRTVSSVNTGYYNLDTEYVFPIRDKKHVTGKVKELSDQKKIRLGGKDENWLGTCCVCGGKCYTGANYCFACFVKKNMIKRPTKEELEPLIGTMSFDKIGKTFGVSPTTVRRWCKYYELPFLKKDLKNKI